MNDELQTEQDDLADDAGLPEGMHVVSDDEDILDEEDAPAAPADITEDEVL